MANDYGYFGSGSTGHAHYTQSFDRNFGKGGAGGSNGGGGGYHFTGWFIAIVVVCSILSLFEVR